MQSRNYNAEIEELLSLCRSQDQLVPVQTSIQDTDSNAVKFMWLTSDGKRQEVKENANS